MKRLIVAVVILLALVFASSFVIPQGSYGLKYDVWHSSANPTLIFPGLHFKWPFAQKVILGNARPQLLLAEGATGKPYFSIQTFDQHSLELGYALMWRVSDPLKFYHANLNNHVLADLRNDLNNSLSQGFSLLTLTQLLQGDLQETVITNTLSKLHKKAGAAGIQLVSLMITSTNIAPSEKSSWINHIQAQQQTQLDQLRQKTAILSQVLQAATDNKVAETLTHGKIQADQIRAQADQEATKIYSAAYNKDPTFYEFYHNLQLYKKVLSNKQDVLVLSTQTPFFKSLSQTYATTK